MGRSTAQPMAQPLQKLIRSLLVLGLFVNLSNGQENAEAQAQVLTPSNFNIAQGRTVSTKNNLVIFRAK